MRVCYEELERGADKFQRLTGRVEYIRVDAHPSEAKTKEGFQILDLTRMLSLSCFHIGPDTAGMRKAHSPPVQTVKHGIH